MIKATITRTRSGYLVEIGNREYTHITIVPIKFTLQHFYKNYKLIRKRHRWLIYRNNKTVGAIVPKGIFNSRYYDIEFHSDYVYMNDYYNIITLDKEGKQVAEGRRHGNKWCCQLTEMYYIDMLIPAILRNDYRSNLHRFTRHRFSNGNRNYDSNFWENNN